jgi:hypothetical protein
VAEAVIDPDSQKMSFCHLDGFCFQDPSPLQDPS